ncbi:hypothetical protein [Paenibacillus sp. PAMC21692]|uniref:hypothetical protein n=1 Tax=Paenibacillus sp. PAMC21692 TaxID=2762320 RepID=UPI00164DA14F|nr:hypothetical protein [Paenibacillus sp. PAMC21692]QNK54574.1 hypothetical protein H7F31_18105 [Paenibacillus sp. PAMC21692]
MRYRYQYTDEASKQSLILEHADKNLVEQQNIQEGDFLVFADEPISTPPQPLEQEIADLKAQLALVQTALDDLILGGGL